MRSPGDEVGLKEKTCACVLSNSWGKFLIIYLFSSQVNQPKTLISQSKGKEIDKLRQSLLADSATKTDFVSVFNFKSTYNFTICTPRFVVYSDVDKQIFWRYFCDLKEPVKHRSLLALANISWDPQA